MGPKLSINLFSIGLGLTILLVAEGLIDNSLGNHIVFVVLAAAVCLAGLVGIILIKAKQKI